MAVLAPAALEVAGEQEGFGELQAENGIAGEIAH